MLSHLLYICEWFVMCEFISKNQFFIYKWNATFDSVWQCIYFNKISLNKNIPYLLNRNLVTECVYPTTHSMYNTKLIDSIVLVNDVLAGISLITRLIHTFVKTFCYVIRDNDTWHHVS